MVIAKSAPFIPNTTELAGMVGVARQTLLAEKNSDLVNIRETFVLNQLHHSHRVQFPATGDFLVDGRYTLEVGGRKPA